MLESPLATNATNVAELILMRICQHYSPVKGMNKNYSTKLENILFFFAAQTCKKDTTPQTRLAASRSRTDPLKAIGEMIIPQIMASKICIGALRGLNLNTTKQLDTNYLKMGVFLSKALSSSDASFALCSQWTTRL